MELILVEMNLSTIFTGDHLFAKVDETVPVTQVKFGNTSAIIDNGIKLQIELEKLESKEVLIKGSITADMVFNCDRCGEPAKYNFKSELTKQFRPDKTTEEEEDFIEGYILDLEKMALNEIYVNFPMKVLCAEDCKGICKSCGANLNVGSCNCADDNFDLRFAGLKDLFDENFKEV